MYYNQDKKLVKPLPPPWITILGIGENSFSLFLFFTCQNFGQVCPLPPTLSICFQFLCIETIELLTQNDVVNT